MKEIKRFEPFFNEWKVCASLERTGYVGMYIIKSDLTCETSILNHISVPLSEENVNAIRKMVSSESEVFGYFEKNKKLILDEIDYAISLNECEYIYKTYEYEVREKEDKIGWDIFVRLEDLKKAGELRELNDIIKMGIDICSALEFCEEKNIVHRNITPEAIYYSRDGRFKLGNFKLYDSDAAININYASPELADGLETDIQTDIYSLGIVLFQFLNEGMLPFVQKDERNDIVIRSAAMDRLKGKRLQLPENVDSALAKAVLSACNPNREQRYKTPTDFKRSLIAAWKKIMPLEANSSEEVKSEEDKRINELEKKINDDLEALGLSSVMAEIADEIKEAENAMQAAGLGKKAKMFQKDTDESNLGENKNDGTQWSENQAEKGDLHSLDVCPSQIRDKINNEASAEKKAENICLEEGEGTVKKKFINRFLPIIMAAAVLIVLALVIVFAAMR